MPSSYNSKGLPQGNKSGSSNVRTKGSFRSFGLSPKVTAKLTINGGLSQDRAIPVGRSVCILYRTSLTVT